MESAVNKIGKVAGGIARGIGIAGAAIAGAFIAATEGTREYRQQMGLLESAYQTAGHSNEAARRTYSELNAVLGDTGQAVEAAQHIALIADNEKELSTWTNIAAGVYATFGESLPIEGLTEAANETAKTGAVTGSLADALNWAGISEEEFNAKLDACTNEQQRQKLIMDTLNGTYAEASAQYKETNKDIMDANRANERLTNVFAELGRIGEPILTAIKNGIAGMAENAIPHIENLINKVRDMKDWIDKNGETVKAWAGVIIGVTTTIAAFILIMNFGKIMTAAANTIKTVRLAMLALNTAMLANPVGVVVALLAGLVAAFVYLWNNVEGFRKFWLKTWDNIKAAASKAKTAITKTYLNIGTWFKDKFGQISKSGQDALTKVKQWFSDTYKSITRTFSGIGTWFKNKFQSAYTGIKNVFSGWGSFFGGLWAKIREKFGTIGTSIGKSMDSAVKSGLNRVLSTVESTINKGIGLINSAITLANRLPGIDVGKVKTLSLPRLFRGGVLEQGQVGILEGTGAEAVVPLEHNEAWLSKLAYDLDKIQMQNNKRNDIGGNTEQIENLLHRIIALLEKLNGFRMYLDTGALVGELTPAIDGEMSMRWQHARRGNTR